MRHDIDISLDSALTIAEWENEYDVKATYFVMLASPFYNAMEQSNLAKIKQILELGHEIGLHFIGSQPWIGKQIDLLTFALNYGVTSVSQDGLFAPKSGPVVVGNPEIITPNTLNAKYISDSCMWWREGCMHEWVDKAGRLQILTHPEWWVEPTTTLAKTLTTFRKHMQDNSHD